MPQSAKTIDRAYAQEQEKENQQNSLIYLDPECFDIHEKSKADDSLDYSKTRLSELKPLDDSTHVLSDVMNKQSSYCENRTTESKKSKNRKQKENQIQIAKNTLNFTNKAAPLTAFENQDHFQKPCKNLPPAVPRHQRKKAGSNVLQQSKAGK